MPAKTSTGQLFIVSAPSGVGKSTIIRKVIEDCPNLEFSVSSTTRSMRSGEVPGKDYNFLTEKEFTQGINSGRFLEWAHVHGQFYGTDRFIVENRLKAGKDLLLDIDVQGARLVRCSYPSARTIFILPPTMNALEERLRNRATETEEQFAIRMAAARQEILEAPWFDFVVINDKLQEAVEDIKAIIRSARSSREVRAQGLKTLLMSLKGPVT